MKQIIQSYKTGEMKLEEVPLPTVSNGTVLIETRASVISAGTEKMIVELAKMSLLGKAKARPDLVRKVLETVKKEGILATFRKVQGKLDNPIPLGYSCAGVVKQTGDGVDGFQVGDLVACGGANYATHAEFNVVPQNLCVHIPRKPGAAGIQAEYVSFEEAAFATVGAIALQGVRQASLTLGENVCVIGLGLLGQLTVQLCKAHGCRVIGCDIDEEKIKKALSLGAEDACRTGELAHRCVEFTRGIGADAVIITASAKGSELVELSGELARPKGRVVAVGLVGLNVPRDIYYRKELDLRLSMSYGPGRYDVEYEERGHDYPVAYVRWTEQRNMEAFLDLVVAGKVDVGSLISHRYPFESALDAYSMITGGKESSLGVILRYEASPEPGRIVIRDAKPGVSESIVTLGVAGAGNFATGVLLPRLKAMNGVSLKGVATAAGASARSVADKFGFEYCAESADALIGDDSINAILIATRHNLHGPLVRRALDAGKHVYVEKPLCTSEEELREIVRTYRGMPVDRILMVGFNRRFSTIARQAKAALSERSSPLVASYRVNAGFISRDSWVQDPVEGAGRIIGESCHFVDMLRFLVGVPVKAVQAACIASDDVRQTNRDSVSVTLRYEDGSLGHILYYALGGKDYPKEKVELAFDGKSVVIDDYRTFETYGGRKVRSGGKQDKGFDEELKEFTGAILSGGALPIPFQELVESTLVTFAVHEALNTGETVFLSEKLRDVLAGD